MENILASVLGGSAVAFVWVVVVAFRAKQLAEQNQESIRNLEDWISRNDELINRRIDQEIDRTDRLYSDSISFTNSRVDKLEQKLTGNLGAKEILKG